MPVGSSFQTGIHETEEGRRRSEEGENARLEEETQLALLTMLLLVKLHYKLDIMTKLKDCTKACLPMPVR